MTLAPLDFRCAYGRRRWLPGTPCSKMRWQIPGAVSAETCYRHMSDETRAVLRAMGGT